MKILQLSSLRLFYILFIAFSVSFVACKGGSGGLDLSGEWSAEMEMTDDMSEEDKAMAEMLLKGFKLNFKGGGKVEFQMMGMSQEGTYNHNKEKNVVEITIEGDMQEFKINGNKLEAEQDGMKLTFKKS